MNLYKELEHYACMYECIKEEKRPILLYGMGDGAEKIHKELTKRGIDIKGVFASEDFVRGQSFLGFRVLSLSEAETNFADFTAVLCFALEGEKAGVLETVKERHKLFSPNLPVFGDGVLDKKNIFSQIEKAQKLLDYLADDKSKELFINLLKYNITGNTEYLFLNKDAFSYPNGFFLHNKRHIDVGAYDGDTVREYTSYNNIYSDIVAFEPDIYSYKKLIKNTYKIRNVVCENAAVNDKNGYETITTKKNRGSFIDKRSNQQIKTVSIDNYCNHLNINNKGIEVGSIKIDAEGADRQVLYGMVNTIYNNKPDLMVALYHRAYDILDIPLLIKKYNHKYKLYLRKKDYVPAWDVFLLAKH